MHLHVSYAVDAGVFGFVPAKCPHCRKETNLQRRRYSAEFLGAGVPAGDVLECPECGKYARQLGLAARLAWTILWSVCLLLILGMAGILVWLVATNLDSSLGIPPVEIMFPILAAFGVVGFAGWKIVRGVIGLWSGLARVQGVSTSL